MNHCVPDFEMEDEFSILTCSSSIAKQKAEDDIMELLWQNGQVVVQSQTQRSIQKSLTSSTLAEPLPPPPENTYLFMAEDEMASWLHYPLEDLTDLLYPTSTAPSPPPPSPPQTLAQSAPARAINSQPPPLSKPPVPPQKNFSLFSKFRGRAPAHSTGLTVVDSNKPGAMPVTAPSVVPTSVGDDSAALSRAPSFRGGGGSGDMTVSSSLTRSGSGSGSGSGTSGCGADVEGAGERKQEVAVDRKRKGREMDEAATTTTTTACQSVSEDVGHESGDEKKHCRGSAAKRSRAAEVHNLSERRRRDRINEKMRALQELIPRCNKSDKASMLDEAIEYLKSLQMQLQMMSMGCGMVPMMYPGMQQQYMPVPPMGMGMGMDMGMSRPMMSSFPSAVPASALPQTPGGSLMFTTPTATGAPQLAPRFPISSYPMTPVGQPGLSSNQASNQAELVPNPIPMQTPGLPQLSNMADPYQQYLALQQMHLHMHMQSQSQNQNQSISQPGSSRPSSSKPSTSMSEEEFDDS